VYCLGAALRGLKRLRCRSNPSANFQFLGTFSVVYFSCWSHRTRFSFSIVENALVSLQGNAPWRKFSPAFNLHHSVRICNSASIRSLQKRDVPRQLFCFVIYTSLILPKLLQPVQASDTLHRVRIPCILNFPLNSSPPS
jgi:hypothetical protein